MSSAQTARLQLVFLIGTQHSGTQWVQLLLAQHPAVATGAATELFSRYLQPLLVDDSGTDAKVGNGGLPNALPAGEYRKFVTSVASAALRHIAARKPKASVLLEASPTHAMVWRDILRYFPGARFVHVVRDPRAVVAELKAEDKANTGRMQRRGIVENAMIWQQEVESVRELVEDGRRCFEVRYERLQSRPADVLLDLLKWLGLRGYEEHAQTFVNRLARHPIAARGLPWRRDAGGSDPADSPSRAEEPPTLRGGELACVELVNRDAMIRYAYDAQSSGRAGRARLKLAAHRFLQGLEDGAHRLRRRL